MATKCCTAFPPDISMPDSHAPSGPVPASRRTVDAPLRMFHALFVLCFFGAYWTSEGEKLRALHVTFGYILMGLLAFRVVYGVIGPQQARLGALWRKLSGLGAWLGSLRTQAGRGASVWRQGQNLLMTALIVVLLVFAVPLTLSGYAIYHDWGNALGGEWMAQLHEVVGNSLFITALGHIAVVVVLSVLRKRNMPWTMVTGRIPGPGPDLVKKPRTWLAVLMLLCAIGFAAWQWTQTPNGLLGRAQDSGQHESARSNDHHDD